MAKRPAFQRVPVAPPREEGAPEHWLRSIRLSGFTVLMLGMLVLAVIVLAPNLRILIQQQQTIAELNQQVSETKHRVKDLRAGVGRWSDPAYVESQARERLYFVFPGDVSYLVIGDSSSATSDGLPISSKIQTTKVDWLHSLVASIYTAGLTDAPPIDLVTTKVGQ
ncbi:MAG: septum formation initiator family protein [Salinibacterium sp.]|nr:MAG: septum formation initiator family protein [Salinibacterium sp.]